MKKGELGFLDYALVLVACTSALYALGESLSRHTLAIFLAVGAAISILTGYFLSKALAGKKIRDYDGYIWTAIAFATAIFSRALNGILPDDGFPFMLFAGAWLSWMVLLCGLVSWRDQTLLFLNLPCISIFALVGTFDTFAPATVLFFVFLVCSSLLYARIHQRAMVVRARAAGVSSPHLLERDAWRWMAGPEWALASAGVIVVLSLVFGPILRFSLSPVAGSMRVQMPQPTTTNPIANALQNTEMQVGKGPIDLPHDVVFKVKLDKPDYLRTSYYVEYRGNGWNRTRGGSFVNAVGVNNVSTTEVGTWVNAWPQGAPLENIFRADVKEIAVRGPGSGLIVLPAPGPIVAAKLSDDRDTTFSLSGLVYRRGGIKDNEVVNLRYALPGKDTPTGESVFPERMRTIERYFTDINKTPETVKAFAARAIAGTTTDYERATKIKEAIEKTAQYTLKAPALSPLKDAVEQFLFTTQKGYCDLFATSMVVCARSVGLKARYTTGYFVSDTLRDSDGFYDVLASDAHAWAEVYLEGRGWVKFDATEGAQVAPDSSTQEELSKSRPWVPYTIGAAIIALACAAGALWRFRFAPKTVAKPVADRLDANRVHQEFDRTLRKRTGAIRRFSQTTTEYVTAVSAKLGDHAGATMALAERLERACFGPDDPTREVTRQLSTDVKELDRALGRSGRP